MPCNGEEKKVNEEEKKENFEEKKEVHSFSNIKETRIFVTTDVPDLIEIHDQSQEEFGEENFNTLSQMMPDSSQHQKLLTNSTLSNSTIHRAPQKHELKRKKKKLIEEEIVTKEFV